MEMKDERANEVVRPVQRKGARIRVDNKKEHKTEFKVFGDVAKD